MDIVDIVVPERSSEIEYNYHEWLCDQSHTRCLRAEEFHVYFRLFDMEVISARSRDLKEGLMEWMDFSLTEQVHREQLLRAVKDELAGGSKTGLSPYEQDAVLYFRQRDLSIVGCKLP